MARRWTTAEENKYREELYELYVRQNKTIGEIAEVLHLSESSVFKRLGRLKIPSSPQNKAGYLRSIKEISIPPYSEQLAEFFGIMLGDGHISHFQTIVTLGTKEIEYVYYVENLMEDLFRVPATIGIRADGYRDVYIGSVRLTSWLKEQGLVQNKVARQVGVPHWIYEHEEYIRGFLRGFFDTDGSFYLLRFGRQISLTNHSVPLLHALREMLLRLEYRPSEVSAFRVYLTRKSDIERFFNEIRPANAKHLRRFENLTRR